VEQILYDVEVVDQGDATQVEQVLAGSAVTGTAALPVADVGKGVLDLDPLTEYRAPGGGWPGVRGVRPAALRRGGRSRWARAC